MYYPLVPTQTAKRAGVLPPCLPVIAHITFYQTGQLKRDLANKGQRAARKQKVTIPEVKSELYLSGVLEGRVDHGNTDTGCSRDFRYVGRLGIIDVKEQSGCDEK